MFRIKKFSFSLFLIICLSCILSAFLLVFTGRAAVAEPQKIRIGYVSLPGFLYKDDIGNYDGYAYELLQEIAIYNNWEYEYVETTYDGAYALLESDTIDLFLPYQKTPERAGRFEFGSNFFYHNRASLLTSPDANLYFEDFSSLDGATIGVVNTSENESRFQAYLQAHGCNVTFRSDYNTMDEMRSALNRNEIQAFISPLDLGVSNAKIICILPETESFVVAKKGEQRLVSTLDNALDRINENTPTFTAQLEVKYHQASENAYPSLTKTECDYIAQKQVVTVMVGPQDMNLSTGEFQGSIGEILRLITAQTGLTFRPVSAPTSEQIFSDFSEGKADILFSFDRDYNWAALHNALLTNEYATFNSVLIKSKTIAVPTTIAVVKGSYLEYYANAYLDNYTIIPFASYRECIDKVNLGTVDAALCSSTLGNYYASFPEYNRLSFSTVFDISSSYCIAVSKHSDALLVGILNKAMSSIPRSVMNTYFEVQSLSRPFSFTDYFYQNPKSLLGAVAIIILILCGICFSAIFMYSMQRKNQKLISANRAKSDFYSRMSHDMRTPMNGIIGLVNLSKDETDSDILHSNIEKIGQSGEYLLALINDTLDMSKIENRKLVLAHKTIYFRSFIDNITSLIRPSVEQKGLIFELCNQGIDLDCYIQTDEVRLKQIFMNLLSNSIKFTPAGGTITLTMVNRGTDHDIVHNTFILQDTGIGMSKEFLEKELYQPFSQEHNDITISNAGSGLGLAIVKNLVTLMKGRIQVDSEPGKGTTFTLDFDFIMADSPNNASEPAISPAEDPRIRLHGKRILLCDDHPVNLEVASRLLSKIGAETVQVQDGQAAVTAFVQSEIHSFDAILMDIRMPVMDGLEAARVIRALDRPDAKCIPIIAVSANAYQQDADASKEAGMNAHIAKPFVPHELFQTIASLIGER